MPKIFVILNYIYFLLLLLSFGSGGFDSSAVFCFRFWVHDVQGVPTHLTPIAATVSSLSISFFVIPSYKGVVFFPVRRPCRDLVGVSCLLRSRQGVLQAMITLHSSYCYLAFCLVMGVVLLVAIL